LSTVSDKNRLSENNNLKSDTVPSRNIIGKFAEIISKVVNWVGAGVLAVMMFLIAADVAMRYIFNSPIPGAQEVSEFMLIMVIFFGIGYAGFQRRHVFVDLVINRLSSLNRLILDSIVNAFCFIIFAIVAWRAVTYALYIQSMGGQSLMLRLSLSPFIMLIAFGSALLAIVLLSQFIGSVVPAMLRNRWKTAIWLLVGFVIVSFLLWVSFAGQNLFGNVSPFVVGVTGIVVLFLLLSTGMPIGFVMITVGFLGVVFLRGAEAGLNNLGNVPYRACSFEFVVIPLFILMGELALHSKLSSDLYNAAYKWLGQFKGGLASATVAGCAGFAAICGENVAVATTMGAVSLPEMKKYKYDPGLAAASVASAGTLGVLIPPSLALILYGLLTQQSIGTLFIAAIVPGVLMAVLMMLMIHVRVHFNPALGPPGPKTSWREKITSLKGVWGILALFALVMGGIYFGIFTPTEGAGIGAFGAFVFTIITKRFKKRNFATALISATNATAMALIILIGASMFSVFMSVSTLPQQLATAVTTSNFPPIVVLLLVTFVLVLVGCVMSGIATLLLTVPVFYPALMQSGFDPIWIGIYMAIMWNVACITPPVGITVFVIKGVAPEIPMYTIFKGVVPFLIVMVICIALLVAFPQIVTFLPALLK